MLVLWNQWTNLSGLSPRNKWTSWKYSHILVLRPFHYVQNFRMWTYIFYRSRGPMACRTAKRHIPLHWMSSSQNWKQLRHTLTIRHYTHRKRPQWADNDYTRTIRHRIVIMRISTVQINLPRIINIKKILGNKESHQLAIKFGQEVFPHRPAHRTFASYHASRWPTEHIMKKAEFIDPFEVSKQWQNSVIVD